MTDKKPIPDAVSGIIEDGSAIVYVIQRMISDTTEAICLTNRLTEIHRKLASDFETVSSIRSTLVDECGDIIVRTGDLTEDQTKNLNETLKNRDISCLIDQTFCDSHLSASKQIEDRREILDETFKWETEMLKVSIDFLEKFEEIKKMVIK